MRKKKDQKCPETCEVFLSSNYHSTIKLKYYKYATLSSQKMTLDIAISRSDDQGVKRKITIKMTKGKKKKKKKEKETKKESPRKGVGDSVSSTARLSILVNE